jgi:hypothetical protein
LDAVLRQQQQFVEEQRLQNKQIELKRAELQELNVEIFRQQNVIKTQQNELAKSAKKKLRVPEVQPTMSFEQFNRSTTASTQSESSSYAKQPAVSKPTSRLPSLSSQPFQSSQQRKKKRQNFFYEKCASPKMQFSSASPSSSHQQELQAQHPQLPTPQQQLPLDSPAMHNNTTHSQPPSHPNFELHYGLAAQQQNLPISDWKLQVMRLYYQEKLRESSVREFEQMLNKFN